ncbi:MAG: alanine racemase [Verrucomicrobiota bacterium]
MNPDAFDAADIPTPFLAIDGSAVRRNIRRLSDYGRAQGLNLRPHTKTHKSLNIGRSQLEAGAIGLTTAKVGEAGVMAELGKPVLIAYPLVDPARAREAARLAGEHSILAAVDSELALEQLGRAAQTAGTRIGILIDMDIGVGRTGVQTPEAALALGQRAEKTGGLDLRGIFLYPGHVTGPAEQQADPLGRAAEKLGRLVEAWNRSGLDAGIVSGGSTPSAYQSHHLEGLTEIRPGTYVFNDLNTLRGGFCAEEDCAARIMATVVSDSVPGQIVLDAGTKTLTSDLCGPAPESGHGAIDGLGGARIHKLTEEHGQVDVSECDTVPRLGERVAIIPNHICPCVNLQDRLWWQEEPEAPFVPMEVDARGLLS